MRKEKKKDYRKEERRNEVLDSYEEGGRRERVQNEENNLRKLGLGLKGRRNISRRGGGHEVRL